MTMRKVLDLVAVGIVGGGACAVGIGVALVTALSVAESWHEGEIARRFRALPPPLHPAVDVTAALADLLPVGAGIGDAERLLRSNGFSCGPDHGPSGVRCRRRIVDFPCEKTWLVILTLAGDGSVAAMRSVASSTCD
jgi:hypothetical protein